MQNGVPYIDSSRRLHTGRGREDVHDSGTGDCVWRVRIGGLWTELLDYNLILIVGQGIAPTKRGCSKPSFCYSTFRYFKTQVPQGSRPRRSTSSHVISWLYFPAQSAS